MRTLADLKRRCTAGTVIEITRLQHHPGTYLRVIKQVRTHDLVLQPADGGSGVSYVSWGSAKSWRFSEEVATKVDADLVELARLRFPDEAELAQLQAEGNSHRGWDSSGNGGCRRGSGNEWGHKGRNALAQTTRRCGDG